MSPSSRDGLQVREVLVKQPVRQYSSNKVENGLPAANNLGPFLVEPKNGLRKDPEKLTS